MPRNAAKRRAGLPVAVAWCGFACLAVFSRAEEAGPPPPPKWQALGAPYRVELKGRKPPDDKRIGWAIEVPEFGVTRPDARDMILFDDKGKELPLDTVWRGEGREVLLLAQEFPEGASAWLYFGGAARRFASWKAEPSLLMETCRRPPNADTAKWPGFQAAWKNSPAYDGAGFVPTIFHGANPYGDSRNFLTHFSGWLRVPSEGRWTFYTMSENESYVFLDGRPVVSWSQGQASPRDPKGVPTGEASLKPGLVRLDYWHSFGPGDHPGMVLGWKLDGKLGTVPESAWLRPGAVEVGKITADKDLPVPLPKVEALSYLGFGGEWLVEAQAALPDPPEGWDIQWVWPDGVTMTGPVARRVLFNLDPTRVALRMRKGNEGLQGAGTLVVPRQVRAASVNDGGDLRRYMDLLEAEEADKLPEPARRAGFVLVEEFADAATVDRWAEAWLAVAPPTDGAWVRAQSVRLRWMARQDAKKALEALRTLPAQAKAVMKDSYPRLELDLLVFGLHDPSVPGLVASLQRDRNSLLAGFARLRLGDYFRLTGDLTQATEAYRTAGDQSPEAQRRGPALDRAFSLALEDLIKDGRRSEARNKVAEWERQRPSAKLETDFLLWRARVLGLDGDWKAAGQELESSLKVRPSSPEEIDVRFWLARAWFETGRKDEARKAWEALAKEYPKHEQAAACKEWAAKP